MGGKFTKIFAFLGKISQIKSHYLEKWEKSDEFILPHLENFQRTKYELKKLIKLFEENHRNILP